MSPASRIALQHVFVVRVGDGGGELLGAFTEIKGIGVQCAALDYEEGGNPYVVKLRGRMTQSNLTLMTGLTSPGALTGWVLSPNPAPKNIYVTFQTPAGRRIRAFGFAGAIPVGWTGPDANIAADAVATESLELAHQGFIPVG